MGVAQTRLGLYAEAWTALRAGLEAAEATQSVPTIMDVLDGTAAYFLARGFQQEARELLQLLADHPAAESQYRDRAQARLTQLELVDVTVRPLDEMVRWLLFEYTDE